MKMNKVFLIRRVLQIAAIAFAAAIMSCAASAQKPLREFALKAERPKFWELIDEKAQLSKVAGGFGFTEGPVWDERGFLYVSDEEQNKIYKVREDGTKQDRKSTRLNSSHVS